MTTSEMLARGLSLVRDDHAKSELESNGGKRSSGPDAPGLVGNPTILSGLTAVCLVAAVLPFAAAAKDEGLPKWAACLPGAVAPLGFDQRRKEDPPKTAGNPEVMWSLDAAGSRRHVPSDTFARMRAQFRGRTTLFIGDSTLRNMWVTLACVMSCNLKDNMRWGSRFLLQLDDCAKQIVPQIVATVADPPLLMYRPNNSTILLHMQTQFSMAPIATTLHLVVVAVGPHFLNLFPVRNVPMNGWYDGYLKRVLWGVYRAFPHAVRVFRGLYPVCDRSFTGAYGCTKFCNRSTMVRACIEHYSLPTRARGSLPCTILRPQARWMCTHATLTQPGAAVANRVLLLAAQAAGYLLADPTELLVGPWCNYTGRGDGRHFHPLRPQMLSALAGVLQPPLAAQPYPDIDPEVRNSQATSIPWQKPPAHVRQKLLARHLADERRPSFVQDCMGSPECCSRLLDCEACAAGDRKACGTSSGKRTSA
eukprot:gene12125-2211_t